MKKRILIVVIMVLPMGFLILLDFLNITNILPFTEKYDWLSFIGSYIAGVCTLILGIVSIRQNETLSNINKQMLNNDIISSNYSKIELASEHFYEDSPSKSLEKSYGIIMEDKKQNNTDYNRLIVQLEDLNELPLMCASIKEMKLYYNSDRPYSDESKIYFSNGEEVKLEVTPHEDKITYYLPICIVDNKETLEKIFNGNVITLEATILVKNVFNVISEADYTIHFIKGYRRSDDWQNYGMHGRKIYFKKVTYDTIRENQKK